jgi:hypothetical protein
MSPLARFYSLALRDIALRRAAPRNRSFGIHRRDQDVTNISSFAAFIERTIYAHTRTKVQV